MTSTAPVKKSKNKKQGIAKSWYAVTRGRIPGVYSEWKEAKAQVNGFASGRSYRASCRNDAIEIFMRFMGGFPIGLFTKVDHFIHLITKVDQKTRVNATYFTKVDHFLQKWIIIAYKSGSFHKQ